MSKTFAEFSLHETLQQALEGLGFTNPTPVQEQSIPAALEGKDLLFLARLVLVKLLHSYYRHYIIWQVKILSFRSKNV